MYSHTWSSDSATRLTSDKFVVRDPVAAAYYNMNIYAFLHNRIHENQLKKIIYLIQQIKNNYH